jgi:hypothetical protein
MTPSGSALRNFAGHVACVASRWMTYHAMLLLAFLVELFISLNGAAVYLYKFTSFYALVRERT